MYCYVPHGVRCERSDPSPADRSVGCKNKVVGYWSGHFKSWSCAEHGGNKDGELFPLRLWPTGYTPSAGSRTEKWHSLPEHMFRHPEN